MTMILPASSPLLPKRNMFWNHKLFTLWITRFNTIWLYFVSLLNSSQSFTFVCAASFPSSAHYSVYDTVLVGCCWLKIDFQFKDVLLITLCAVPFNVSFIVNSYKNFHCCLSHFMLFFHFFYKGVTSRNFV